MLTCAVAFLVFLGSISPIARANVLGLPSELNGANEEAIEFTAVNEVAERNNCELNAKEIRAIQKQSQFKITKSKRQPSEYAEYRGELSSFTLRATVALPQTCKKNGTWVCSMHFDLYDVKSYAIDTKSTKCNPGN